MKQCYAFVTKCGERSETTTQSSGKKQPCLYAQLPTLAVLIEDSNHKAAEQIGNKGCPWEDHSLKAWMQREVTPEHGYNIAENTARASANEYV